MSGPESPHTSQPTFTGKQKSHQAFNRRLSFWLAILLIVVIAAFFRYPGQVSKTKGRGSQKPPVVVATVKTANVPIYLNALGSVTPVYSVTVMTQLNGILMRVLFREGQMVKAGELLAEIDARPYEAQLIQYQGQLQRDQAQLDNANFDLKRYENLWKQNSVSQQVLATQRALVKQLEGTIKIDQGLIEATKVNLIYCKITSPVSGRIGLRLVDAGNLVQTTNTTGIAVVNTLDPITVIFSLPEDNVPEVMEKLAVGTRLTAEAYDRQQAHLLATGQLLTVDNQINPTTGTVKLKAQFQNDKNILFPSQFVNVRLLLKTLKNAVTVPTAAIQQSIKGPFVYVLNTTTLTVTVKPVKTGATLDDTTVIIAGTSPGETVITQGADQLTDGAKVTLPAASPQGVKQRRATA